MKIMLLLAILLTLVGVGCAAEGEEEVGAPVLPPRPLLEVSLPANSLDYTAAIEAKLAAMARDTAATKIIFSELLTVPAETEIHYEPTYRDAAYDLAALFGLEDRAIEALSTGTDAAILLTLGSDFDFNELRLYPAGQVPVITPEELTELGYDSGTVVYVDLTARRSTLFMEGEIIKTWPVCIGKPETPTPPGVYSIIRLKADPIWSWEGRRYASDDPENGLGARWIGISLPTYGMHGTNEPDSIGGALSHGCVRSSNEDVIEFFDYLEMGDTIIWAKDGTTIE
ncbi:L,D-transpeptidase family protein [bacterium]|nr:L,D-transpeptidase family protein [bacterium]